MKAHPTHQHMAVTQLQSGYVIPVHSPVWSGAVPYDAIRPHLQTLATQIGHKPRKEEKAGEEHYRESELKGTISQGKQSEPVFKDIIQGSPKSPPPKAMIKNRIGEHGLPKPGFDPDFQGLLV